MGIGISRSRLVWAILVAALLVIDTEGFQLSMMAYKPPVKSSVKKLLAQRIPISKRSTSHSKSAYAGVAPPAPQQSFQDRMRSIVIGDTDKVNAERRARASLPRNVIHVSTLEDYRNVVGNEKEKIVAVRFYATYCKACQAVAPLFYKLANENPNVIFVDVPVTAKNAALHQGLGVPSLPFGHIYDPEGGLVEEMKLTRQQISDFGKKLGDYTKRSCDI